MCSKLNSTNTSIECVCALPADETERYVSLRSRPYFTEIGQPIPSKQTRDEVVIRSTALPGSTSEFICPRLVDASGKAPRGEVFGVALNPDVKAARSRLQQPIKDDRRSTRWKSIEAVYRFMTTCHATDLSV